MPACAPPTARSIWRCRGCSPARACNSRCCREGQDPDDLVRSGGREAIADVIAAARPLADMLWARETEASRFDTPERRAALEARLDEITAAIGDEAVRKYYRQDFSARLSQLLRAGARRSAASSAVATGASRRRRNWRERRNA